MTFAAMVAAHAAATGSLAAIVAAIEGLWLNAGIRAGRHGHRRRAVCFIGSGFAMAGAGGGISCWSYLVRAIAGLVDPPIPTSSPTEAQ